jgi:SAM-dependent methyltransferase
MKCRFCGSEVKDIFIDLGFSPPSNSFLSEERLTQPEVYYPLKVFVCANCFLVQIDEYKKSAEIFNDTYVYFSSMSTTWLKHCEAYVVDIVSRLGLDPSSLVVEIAANDGYLLRYFVERAIPCIGIEPAASTAEAARARGIHIVQEFFGVSLAERLLGEGRAADLIIANNVLAHVPDINDFVAGFKCLLKPTGTITVEFPHLMRLVENTEFDTIYHEHYSYLSLLTVRSIFETHGLRVYDVEELTTHGGSLRVYATHEENSALRDARGAVESLVSREEAAGMKSMGYYRGFQNRVAKVKLDFLSFLVGARLAGKSVAAYGAAAKGNTFLNFCGIKSDLIDFVVDASTSKQGKFLPGSHVPVTTEDALRKRKPDYIIILPWNLEEEITKQLSYTRQWGAMFVVAVPHLEVKCP